MEMGLNFVGHSVSIWYRTRATLLPLYLVFSVCENLQNNIICENVCL